MLSTTTDWTGAPFALSWSQMQAILGFTTSPIWTISPRYRLVDRSLGAVGTGGTSTVGDPADLTQWVESCTVTADSTRPVHVTADLLLHSPSDIIFNPTQHLIHVLLDWWDSAGNLLFEVPVGYFASLLPDRDVSPTGIVEHHTMADMSSWISQIGAAINTYTVAANYSPTQAAVNMICSDSLPLSLGGTGQTPVGRDFVSVGWSPSRVNKTEAGTNTPFTIPMSRADNLMTFINDKLLTPINYWPLRVDPMGVLQIKPRTNLSAGLPPLVWSFKTDETSIMKVPVSWRALNGTDMANVVPVYSEDAASGKTLSSTAYNTTSTESAISITNLGRAIVAPAINDSNIPDQISCDARAQIELQWRATVNAQVTFQSPPVPFVELHDRVGVTVTDLDGQVIIDSSNGWEVIAYSLDLSSTPMQSWQVGKLLAV